MCYVGEHALMAGNELVSIIFLRIPFAIPLFMNHSFTRFADFAAKKATEMPVLH